MGQLMSLVVREGYPGKTMTEAGLEITSAQSVVTPVAGLEPNSLGLGLASFKLH